MFKLEVLRKQNSMVNNRMGAVDKAWLEFFVYIFCYEYFTKDGKFLNHKNVNIKNAIEDIEKFIKSASSTNILTKEFIESYLVYLLARRFKRYI